MTCCSGLRLRGHKQIDAGLYLIDRPVHDLQEFCRREGIHEDGLFSGSKATASDSLEDMILRAVLAGGVLYRFRAGIQGRLKFQSRVRIVRLRSSRLSGDFQEE